VNSLFITMSNEIGSFRAGTVASIVSPVATVAIGGVCAFGIVVAGWVLFPSIRKLDKISDVNPKT